MRIAHATDIHWIETPPLRRLPGKRVLGAVNMALGRGSHFSREVQRSLVQHLIDLQPDVAILTGDLTQTALESEFEAALADLKPLLAAVPTFVIPGNHDVYTTGARDSKRMQHYFGEWMHLRGPLGRLDLGGLCILGLDPCRPGVLSSGLVPQDQLAELGAHLADPSLADRFVVLALHYPLLHPDGRVYDGLNHGLRNASELLSLLSAAPRKPDLILHGHVHRGYTVQAPLGQSSVPIHNCGSSGYGHDPSHGRVAHMNVYDVDGSDLVAVTRYFCDGHAWKPLDDGPYP